MKCWRPVLLTLVLISSSWSLPALSSTPGTEAEPGANVVEIPRQILKTGVSLTAPGMSPNTKQLSDSIGLTPLLEKIQALRVRVSASGAPGMETLAAREDFAEAKQDAGLLIQKTNLDIDFAIGEIDAESQLYGEILSTFTGDRDKWLARINAASFISNGALWAACEAFSIPSFNTVFAKNPKHVVQWPVPSGITGIAAGIIPSLASMYTLKAVNGKQKKSEVDPNMLAKLFGYPTSPDIEYPQSVWNYLNQVPAAEPKGKKRLDQLMDRWVSDSNIYSFTDRKSKDQLDVLTATVSQRKGLSIATLTARSTMLQQLHMELMKMKRMLLELSMVVQGEKQLGLSREE